MENATAPFELCPQCHTSIPFTSYTAPYTSSSVRAFYTPGQADISTIENHLAKPSAELVVVAAEIEHVKLMLQALEKRHAYLDTHITRTRQFIQPSPIRKLPTEVLSIIFEYVCTSDFSSMYRGAAVRLSVVCSKWRDILMNTPTLWTTIVFGSGIDSLPKVNYYLDRCGKLPLCVYLEGPLIVSDHDMTFEEAYERYYKEAMQRLLKTLPQWKHIHLALELYDLSMFEDLLIDAFQVGLVADEDERLAHVPCPSVLESVILAIPDGRQDATVLLPRIFQAAPNLTSFTLLNSYLDPIMAFSSIWPAYGLPWTQIRDITLNHDNLGMLKEIPEEVYSDGKPLTVTICSTRPEWLLYDEGVSPIVFDNITALRLEPQSWFNDLPDFLHTVSLPALQDVTLDCPLTSDAHRGEYMLNDNSLSALTSMVSNSKCTLKAFTFRIFSTSLQTPFDDTFAHAIIALLRETPELESLELIEGEACGPALFTDEFFRVCTMPDGLVPKLKSLKLVWAGDRQPSTGLIPMLQSRVGGLLTSVILGVRNGGGFRSEILRCIRELRDDGVQVSLW